MPQPERYYFTDFHTIGLKKKKQLQSPMFKGSVNSYCKTSKISSGAYIFRRPFLRGLYTEENCTSKSARFIQLYWGRNMPQSL